MLSAAISLQKSPVEHTESEYDTYKLTKCCVG